MSKEKKKKPQTKTKMHSNNRHRERYDLPLLVKSHPDLEQYVRPNKYGDDSIDFANPAAVKSLNTALLMHYYDLKYWEIPEGYLCPPVPGRADYLHHASDLFSAINFGKVPKGEKIRALDIGVGANCIYPIVGVKEFGWKFIGSDIDELAITAAQKIVDNNPNLKEKVELRLQTNKRDIFHGILEKDDRVELVVCNPPFHASAEEAHEATLRKVNNLKQKDHKGFRKKKEEKPVLNFGGQSNELWIEGGEKRFLKDMIRSSKKFPENVFWFTALVSKENTLRGLYEALRAAQATDVRTIPMGTGNKTTRILAWTFQTREGQRLWADKRIRDAKDVGKPITTVDLTETRTTEVREKRPVTGEGERPPFVRRGGGKELKRF